MQAFALVAVVVFAMFNLTFGFQRIASTSVVRANSGISSIRGQMKMMARKKKEMPPNPVAGFYTRPHHTMFYFTSNKTRLITITFAPFF